MVINETYDNIIGNLDRYSINEGFFFKKKKKSKKDEEAKTKEYCIEITNTYNKWIKEPYELRDGGDDDMLILAKWYNVSMNTLFKRIKASSKMKLLDTSNLTDQSESVNIVGKSVYSILINDDYALVATQKGKFYEMLLGGSKDQISEWNLSKANDYINFGSISKEEYFKYLQ